LGRVPRATLAPTERMATTPWLLVAQAKTAQTAQLMLRLVRPAKQVAMPRMAWLVKPAPMDLMEPPEPSARSVV